MGLGFLVNLFTYMLKNVSVLQKQKNVNEWPYLNWNLFQASVPPLELVSKVI